MWQGVVREARANPGESLFWDGPERQKTVDARAERTAAVRWSDKLASRVLTHGQDFDRLEEQKALGGEEGDPKRQSMRKDNARSVLVAVNGWRSLNRGFWKGNSS